MKLSPRAIQKRSASSPHKIVTTILLCLATSLTTSTTFAADKKESAKSTSTKKKPAAKKKAFEKTEVKETKEKDAEAEGPKKKWEVLLNAGMEPSPLIGIGATVGRYIKPDLAIEGFFSRATGKVEPVAITVMNIGARARKNFGKIPYVAGGLGMSMASGSWFTYNQGQTDELASSSSENAITLNLGAGAQMQFGSFLVGADAVGIIFPVMKMGVKDTPPGDAYDEDDFNEQKAKFSKVAGGMGLVLLKIGIGMAF